MFAPMYTAVAGSAGDAAIWDSEDVIRIGGLSAPLTGGCSRVRDAQPEHWLQALATRKQGVGQGSYADDRAQVMDA